MSPRNSISAEQDQESGAKKEAVRRVAEMRHASAVAEAKGLLETKGGGKRRSRRKNKRSRRAPIRRRKRTRGRRHRIKKENAQETSPAKTVVLLS